MVFFIKITMIQTCMNLLSVEGQLFDHNTVAVAGQTENVNITFSLYSTIFRIIIFYEDRKLQTKINTTWTFKYIVFHNFFYSNNRGLHTWCVGLRSTSVCCKLRVSSLYSASSSTVPSSSSTSYQIMKTIIIM